MMNDAGLKTSRSQPVFNLMCELVATVAAVFAPGIVVATTKQHVVMVVLME
jgi:hypothetical protein